MRSLCKLFALAVLLALILACTPGTQEPVATSAPAPGADDVAFLESVATCEPKLDAWQAVLASGTADNLCAAYLRQSRPAAEALATCWQELPTPEDADLLRVRRLLLQAATSYSESVEYLSDYCKTGSGDSLSAATASLDLGTMTIETVNALLDAYWAQHPSWKNLTSPESDHS